MPRNTITKPKYFNFETWAMRVDATEKMERKERLEKEKQEMQAVRFRYGNEKETSVMRRAMKASEGDTSAKRTEAIVLEAAVEAKELEKEQAAWDKQHSEIMGEMKGYV